MRRKSGDTMLAHRHWQQCESRIKLVDVECMKGLFKCESVAVLAASWLFMLVTCNKVCTSITGEVHEGGSQ